ncbi:PHA/PHB synthase family protein [Paraburkholderia phytofirmans]|uniref:PHA/PHB synthase family protein n=1 Tax=Paraburkholderia phytofirmans TaxID=261302 RepID=UPI0038BD2139
MDTRTRVIRTDGASSMGGSPPRPQNNAFRDLDHAKEALIARMTGGLSPASLRAAVSDWLIHLMAAPGKQLELTSLCVSNAKRLSEYCLTLALGRQPPELTVSPPTDYRFRAPGWQVEPYRLWYQSFLLVERWWDTATRAVPGTTRHHEDVVAFIARQLLDILAPANFVLTNPEVSHRVAATCGLSLVQGYLNALEDVSRVLCGKPAVGLDQFKVGVNLAVTPGKVVFRNRLIELIQYSPAGDTVLAEPILIVPAWIMKYYILDLSPHNSLIRYLVEQGHTVFCISWRNVDAGDRDLSLEDYRRLGVIAALDTISGIIPDRKVHATGYCLGGTLLSIAAAAMADAGDERLASVTLFAAQTDFTEPGELQLFIDDSEVYFLESMMWSQGYLSANQMSAAFQLLQSNDLIWSRLIHDYLLGDRAPAIDLMAWNADTTRMPYRMHSDYLRRLFLNNDLASGRYLVDRRPVAIRNIRAPMFVVGTERDHIAPWRSVYKIHNLSDTDVTFVLASGGHNAGIVSELGHPRRHFRIKLSAADSLRTGPEEWLADANIVDGSWWPTWSEWLNAHSSTQRVTPPPMSVDPNGQALADAPGSYVFQV